MVPTIPTNDEFLVIILNCYQCHKILYQPVDCSVYWRYSDRVSSFRRYYRSSM